MAFTMEHLRQLYLNACNTPSDIHLHLPVLHGYATKCAHVTEMGARTGNSTVAFLYAHPPKFVSYDYQYKTPEPHLEAGVKQLVALFEACKAMGVNCAYSGADVLKTEIEPTDLLFIDTWHCYAQLAKELKLHGHKAKKYIAFHDTFSYGTRGEGYPSMDIHHPHRDTMDGSGGIRPAIDEFLEAHREWSIEHETKQNNGLIVIAKRG